MEGLLVQDAACVILHVCTTVTAGVTTKYLASTLGGKIQIFKPLQLKYVSDLLVWQTRYLVV